MNTTLLKKQHGFTIIELLVAALLAMILLGSTTIMFVSNKQSAKLQDELGRLQENARFAMDLLTQDLRMANFIGCHENMDTVYNQINVGTNTLLDFTNTLDGADGSATTVQWDASGDNTLISSMAANTDAITIRYLQPMDVQLSSDATTTGNLSIPAGSNLASGTLMAVSDCSSTDLFQNTSTNTETSGTIAHAAGSGTPGNSVATLSKDYDENSEISTLVARRYFIAPSATAGNTRNSLWWTDDASTTTATTTDDIQELVEGVQSMQILYGEDTDSDNDIDGFFTSDSVTTWTNIKAIKVAILMETVNEIGVDLDTNTYNLLGTVIDPVDDLRKRKIFTTTIAIRNRM